MKTLIIYFSQTNNTRKIAECIAEGLASQSAQTALVRLDEVDLEDVADYDLVGLGCPVFYYQEPLNVRAFIDTLPILSAQPWFLFCTHGSIIGNTFHSMVARLRFKQVTILDFYDAYADAKMPFYPHPTYTTGHPDGLDFECARKFGCSLAERRQAFLDGDISRAASPDPVPEEWINNARMFTPEFMARVFPPLKLNLSLCTLCGLCAQNCPVGGIDLTAAKPELQDPCVYCWCCVNTCPEAAIEADWQGQVDMAPKLYRRYRYWLEQAAAAGKFRWLTEPDRIDFTTPYYRQRQNRIRQQPSDGNRNINDS